jgi:hypothetical protein
MTENDTRYQNLESNDTIIQIVNMHKWFGDFHVLRT